MTMKLRTGGEDMPQYSSDVIKETIAINHLSQKQLAKEIDVTPQTLNSYLNGRSQFRIEDFCKIARILQLNPNYLLGFEKPLLSPLEIFIYKSIKSLKPDQRDTIIVLLNHYQDENIRGS